MIGAMSRITKATSASGSAAGASSDAVAPPGADSASSRCGLNGGIFAERSETVSERLPAMRTNGRTRTTSWLPTRLMVETRITWRANVGSSAVGRRSLLCAPFSAPPPSAPRSATSTRSGKRREIGFAVERRENGAAHESSAAESGQDRAGKPLHRNAAAIDEAARAAVDRQRRLIAELDGVGLSRSNCAARPCLVQARRPLRLGSKEACRNQTCPRRCRQAV